MVAGGAGAVLTDGEIEVAADASATTGTAGAASPVEYDQPLFVVEPA